jgi:predicted dienelactone hydrolase
MRLFYLNTLLVVIGLLASTLSFAQTAFVYGDPLPDAPELAPRGEYKVGVRTLDFVNKGQVDILKSKGGVDVTYDRPLKVEVWYPAILPEGVKPLVEYEEVMGSANDPKRPLIPFAFKGRATWEAAPVNNAGPFPLLIVSHGYLGSRYLLTYLTENLASKGYVVVAIDHTESTFRDAAPFQSTLLNRSKDILFTLDQMANLGKVGSRNFLAGLLDGNNVGIIGYSMGGYGVLNAAGAGYSEQFVQTFGTMTGGSKAIEVRTSSHPSYRATVDPRIKAVVAFAPWGMERGVWDAEGLKGLKIPTFFVAGSQDNVSGYEKGVKAIYEGAVNAPRYMLVYENARHNVAPNPPPAEAIQEGLPFEEYYRYAEPAWNERRINNINQHFVTAFLGIYLKNKDYGKYLDLLENSSEKTWTGFKSRTSVGLQLMHDIPAK